VRFAIELPVRSCGLCHCSICRRAHGAGYVTWVGVPRTQFRFLAGEERLLRYRSSEHGTRSFCGTCGSPMLFESTEFLPDEIGITLANLDGPIGLAPAVHAYFDRKADWVVVNDDLPRLGGPTGLELL